MTSAAAVTPAAVTGYRNGEYVHSADAVARRLADLADQLDGCVSMVASSWDETQARARLRGVAAWWLRQSLVLDTDPVRGAASALREASGVMAELAGRFRAAELTRWRAVAAAVGSDPTGGTVGALAGSPVAGLVEAPAVAAETAAAAAAAERLRELAGRSRAARRARQDRGLELVNQVRGWGSEVTLGAAESVGSALGGALDALGLANRVTQDPLHSGDEVTAVADGLLEVIRDPGRLLSAVLDLDTWRSNPERAVGHLVPDLALAATGGGAAIPALRSAAARSAQRVLLERRLRTEAAIMARHALLERAADGLTHRALRPAQQGWAGERGLRLSAEQCEIIARYLRESAAAQAGLRRRMIELARSVGGRLTVLDDALAEVEDHSVKDLGSLMRKVATTLRKAKNPGATGQELLDVLNKQNDTVRYTIVLPERSYVDSARKLARLLDRDAVSPRPWSNTWHQDGYRGINTAWTDVRTGVRFEVQLHTPQSRAASAWTHLDYEEQRLPGTPAERKEQLTAVIAREYRRADPPPGAVDLDLPAPPSPLRGAAAAPPELGAVLVGGGLLISLRSLTGAAGGSPGQAVDPDFRDLRAQVSGPGGR